MTLIFLVLVAWMVLIPAGLVLSTVAAHSGDRRLMGHRGRRRSLDVHISLD